MENKFLKTRSGETLLEVMIAISVLVLIMAPVAELNIKAIRNNTYNRDHLVAENLATEGLEIVRGIRNTNLLRFSTKEELCWNTKPDFEDMDKCGETGNLIKIGSYIIKENIGSPNIELVWKALEPLKDDFSLSDDSEYRLKLDASTKIYSHDTGELTNFHREIFIEYSTSGKTMFISSRVFFKNGAKVKKVTRVTALTSKIEQ